MSFPHPENYLFLPDSTDVVRGRLIELEAGTNVFSENSFVLIPYRNPQAEKPAPLFFRILKEQAVPAQPAATNGPKSKTFLKAATSRENYIEHVKSLKQEIQRGNIYEINYCIQFSAENCEIDPFAVFGKLHLLAKAPYAMLLKTGDDFIISASPELFLKREGDLVFTKPIKGTIRRGKNAEEDAALKKELQNNIKERTENVMAVDVARNDLSVFAKKGSVQVNKLYTIESFETVHQMVSTVSCEAKEGTSFKEIIDATFPMASMTGAPKLRAMTLIGQAEDFKRGNYSGAMGLIESAENFTLSVIIRSIFYNQQTKQLSIAVGGAITYLSDPSKEYEECLLKANALLKALNAEIV